MTIMYIVQKLYNYCRISLCTCVDHRCFTIKLIYQFLYILTFGCVCVNLPPPPPEKMSMPPEKQYPTPP